MPEERYTSFIEEILQMTKEQKIFWNYLDSKESLYTGMHWTKSSTQWGLSGEKTIIRPNFNREDSFYAQISGTYIVILASGNQPATLYVVPNTFKKVVTLHSDEYGELITRLQNLVQSQFPNAENFISNLLEKKDTQNP